MSSVGAAAQENSMKLDLNGGGGDQSNTTRTNQSEGSNDTGVDSKPWTKAPFTPKTHQNRYAAQQKILSDQQSQIKEQQRLIEELQFSQRQQMLKQDIKTQQLIREQLEKMTPQQFAESKVEIEDLETEGSECISETSGNGQGHDAVQNTPKCPRTAWASDEKKIPGLKRYVINKQGVGGNI